MLDYSLTKSRTIQWMIIILVLVALAGAYRYFSVGAATKINSSQNTSNVSGLIGQWSFDGADVTNTVTYATWNSSDKAASFTLSGGDKVVAPDSSGTPGKVRATIGKSSGKWYWEYVIASYTNDVYVGIATSAASVDTYTGAETTSWSMRGDAISVDKNTNGTPTTYGGTGALNTGDVIGVALDMDAGTIVFYINNTSQGTAFTGLTGTLYPSVGDSGSFSTPTITANFGATALTYTPPTGYNAGLYTSVPSGATDTSGSGNNGTLVNGPNPVIGKVGQALNFDGTSQSVTIGLNKINTNVNGASSVTLSAWVKPTAITSQMRLINFHNGDLTGGLLGFQSGVIWAGGRSQSGDTFQSTTVTAPAAGVWSHILCVLNYTSDNISIYLNGVLVKSTAVSFGSNTFVYSANGAGNIDSVGSYDTSGADSDYYNGVADEVRIYNRALSAGEVMSLYNFGVGAKVNASQNSSNGNGLIGQWSFNGEDVSWSSSTAGTATDTSGNSSTGTITNMSQSTSPVRGKVGQAFNFDGTNDYVTMGTPSVLNLTGVMSISAWIYPTGWGGASKGRIVDKDANATTGYIFAIDDTVINTTSGIGFMINGAASGTESLFIANSITLNKWQHVVVTMNTSKLVTLYVNGVSVGSSTLNAFPGSSANNFVIGGRPDNARNFAGSLDEVRVYNRALSAGEITSLYNMGVGTKLTP